MSLLLMLSLMLIACNPESQNQPPEPMLNTQSGKPIESSTIPSALIPPKSLDESMTPKFSKIPLDSEKDFAGFNYQLCSAKNEPVGYVVHIGTSEDSLNVGGGLISVFVSGSLPTPRSGIDFSMENSNADNHVVVTIGIKDKWDSNPFAYNSSSKFYQSWDGKCRLQIDQYAENKISAIDTGFALTGMISCERLPKMPFFNNYTDQPLSFKIPVNCNGNKNDLK